MEPTCLNIIFIRVCVCNTYGFHNKQNGNSFRLFLKLIIFLIYKLLYKFES